jgi:hypothetical protein
MKLIGPLGPGHARIDQDKFFPALDKISKHRKGNFLIAYILDVFMSRMMVMVLLGKGGNIPCIDRPDG